MKKIRNVLLVTLAGLIAFWGISVARCELLTYMHGGEFEGGYLETGMLEKPDFIKVLHYEKAEARIYCVKKHEIGTTIDFVMKDNEWKMKSWGDAAWSSEGSAEQVVWPYVWHLISMR